MKPIIGVMPLWDEEKDSIWMLPGYMDGLMEAGGLPVIFPFSTDEGDLRRLTRLCGGILLTGGDDVSPALYSETPLEGLVSCCEKRDRLEAVVLEEALALGTPVLGICRGLQFINARLGGSLYQDLPSQHPSAVEHRQKPPYDRSAHEVSVLRGSPLFSCLQTERLPVNSCHHQAIRTLAPGLAPMALSPDGLTEALTMPAQPFLWAVQWHPEFSYRTDENSRKIFRAFVEAAGEHAARSGRRGR